VRTSTLPLLVGSSLLAVACQDKVLVRVQDPPSVSIQEPSDGSAFFTGEAITFKALVVSNDGTAFADMTHQWVSGDQTVCISEAVPDDGYALCQWSYDETGDKSVTVMITDPYLNAAQSTITVSIIENTAPSIAITKPTDKSLFAVDDLIVFEAAVSDAEESTENLYIEVTSSGTAGVSAEGYATSAGQFSGAGTLDAGPQLVTMTVTDSYGKTAQDTVTLEVYEHAPPSVDAVGVLPSPATTVDTLQADVQGWFDLDGSKERSRYRWFKSDETGKLTEDLTEATSTFPSGKTTKGDLVQVEVTPFNDYGTGDPMLSPTIEIMNSAPTAPLVYIEPTSPEPSDNLFCYATDSDDADADTITFTYQWYQNGKLTAFTTNVIEAQYTQNGDSWECYATPSDGEDDGSPGSDYVSVNDTVAPDAPDINTPSAYRNDAEVTLDGTCEADCAMVMYCDDGSTSWTDTLTCDSDGTFEYTTALTSGRSTDCYADCTDGAGNVSTYSNTVATEVCDPKDDYEDAKSYGDDGANAIDEWSAVADDGGTTITVEANILDDDDEDWYLISSSDDVSEDRSDGLDYYNFEVVMTDGTSTYEMAIYKGSYDTTDQDCASGTEYSDSMEDKGEGVHTIPSDVRSCAQSSEDYNECEDNSQDYYIQIVRLSSSVSSCQGYELEVTNGVW